MTQTNYKVIFFKEATVSAFAFFLQKQNFSEISLKFGWVWRMILNIFCSETVNLSHPDFWFSLLNVFFYNEISSLHTILEHRTDGSCDHLKFLKKYSKMTVNNIFLVCCFCFVQIKVVKILFFFCSVWIGLHSRHSNFVYL